jgi:hypothetical protein
LAFYKGLLLIGLEARDDPVVDDWRSSLVARLRALCERLPAGCTFESLALFRASAGTAPYSLVLLVEVNRVLVLWQKKTN